MLLPLLFLTQLVFIIIVGITNLGHTKLDMMTSRSETREQH